RSGGDLLQCQPASDRLRRVMVINPADMKEDETATKANHKTFSPMLHLTAGVAAMTDVSRIVSAQAYPTSATKLAGGVRPEQLTRIPGMGSRSAHRWRHVFV